MMRWCMTLTVVVVLLLSGGCESIASCQSTGDQSTGDPVERFDADRALPERAEAKAEDQVRDGLLAKFTMGKEGYTADHERIIAAYKERTICIDRVAPFDGEATRTVFHFEPGSDELARVSQTWRECMERLDETPSDASDEERQLTIRQLCALDHAVVLHSFSWADEVDGNAEAEELGNRRLRTMSEWFGDTPFEVEEERNHGTSMTNTEVEGSEVVGGFAGTDGDPLPRSLRFEGPAIAMEDIKRWNRILVNVETQSATPREPTVSYEFTAVFSDKAEQSATSGRTGVTALTLDGDDETREFWTWFNSLIESECQ